MFARASPPAHICLRCQRHITQSSRLPAKLQSQPWRQQRWQSAGTASLAHKDDDTADIEYSPEQSTEQPLENANRRPRRAQTYRERHWRPATTANLGVDTLGKPAEVLILPPKQRKQLQESSQEEIIINHETQPGAALVDILQSEAAKLKYVSKDEAHENINAVKQEIGQEGGYLRPDRYAHFRETLRRGFTKGQLSSYIVRQKQGVDTDESLHTEARSKKELATQIMTSVWEYQSSEATEEVVTTRNFSTKQEIIDLFLLDKLDELARLSRLHDVKFDVYRNENYICLSGLEADVYAVYEKISSLRAGIVRGFFEVSPQTYNGLFPAEQVNDSSSRPTSSADESLLSTIMKRHKVILLPEWATKLEKDHKARRRLRSMGVRSVRFVTFDEENVAFLRRDLVMLLRTTKSIDASHSDIIDLDSTKAYTTVPTNELGGEVGSETFRLIASDIIPKSKTRAGVLDHEEDKVEKGLSKKVETLIKSLTSTPQRSEERQSQQLVKPRKEYCVEFGQANFAADMAALVNDKSFVEQASKVGFNLNVPKLPQWLAQQSLREAPSIKLADNERQSNGALIRLCFHADSSENEPTIEVFLDLQKQDNDLPRINVRRVSVILGQTLRYLLLPSHTIDLRILGQDCIHIFEHGKRPRSQYVQILSDIADYLNKSLEQESTQEVPQFRPQLRIDLKRKPIASLLRRRFFFLTSACLVESNVYQAPQESSFALEYLSLEPLPSCPSQETKQVFRVTETPLLNMSSDATADVDTVRNKTEKVNVAEGDQSDLKTREQLSEPASVSTQTSPQKLSAQTPKDDFKQRLTDLIITAYGTAVSLSKFGRS